MGFIHFSGAIKEVRDFVQSTVKRISQNSPQAVRRTKSLVRDIYNQSNPQQTIQLIADLRVSDEGQEGLKAFFEKRKPNWIEQK